MWWCSSKTLKYKTRFEDYLRKMRVKTVLRCNWLRWAFVVYWRICIICLRVYKYNPRSRDRSLYFFFFFGFPQFIFDDNDRIIYQVIIIIRCTIFQLQVQQLSIYCCSRRCKQAFIYLYTITISCSRRSLCRVFRVYNICISYVYTYSKYTYYNQFFTWIVVLISYI